MMGISLYDLWKLYVSNTLTDHQELLLGDTHGHGQGLKIVRRRGRCIFT